MKKAKSDDLRPEYQPTDLGQGVRGKYFEAYKKGTNLVLLSPDVARAFPSEEAVNEALRSLINLAQRTTNSIKLPGERTKNPRRQEKEDGIRK